MTARIAPGERRDIGIGLWTFARIAGRVTGTEPPNVFTTLGRTRGLARAWLVFASKLMPFGRLARRESELVILRVAHHKACRYELDHHTKLGRRAGIAASEVERLQRSPLDDGWIGRERSILLAVDQLCADHDLDDERWADLRRHLDEREAIELCLLVGHYEMLATTITTLRMELDRPLRSAAVPTAARPARGAAPAGPGARPPGRCPPGW